VCLAISTAASVTPEAAHRHRVFALLAKLFAYSPVAVSLIAR